LEAVAGETLPSPVVWQLSVNWKAPSAECEDDQLQPWSERALEELRAAPRSREGPAPRIRAVGNATR